MRGCGSTTGRGRGPRAGARRSPTAWSTTGGAGTSWPGTWTATTGAPSGSTGWSLRTPTGPRFTPRELPPDDDIAAQVARAVGRATWRYRARVVVHASAAYVRGRMPIPVDVEALGDDRCAFEPGSDHPELLALYLGLLDADFEVVDAPELVDALRKVAGRYQRAVDASERFGNGEHAAAGGSSSWAAGRRAAAAYLIAEDPTLDVLLLESSRRSAASSGWPRSRA